MRIVAALATITVLLMAQSAQAEDAPYSLPSGIDCARQVSQSAPIKLDLPDEVQFLAGGNFDSVRIVNSVLDGEVIWAAGNEILVRRKSFGLILKIGAGDVSGTVEVFDKPEFCALLARGFYFRIQQSQQVIATLRLTTGPVPEDTGARSLSLDRIGRKHFARLNYFLGNSHAWLNDELVMTEFPLQSVAESTYSPYDYSKNKDWEEYNSAINTLLRLVSFIDHYDLQHRMPLEEHGKINLSTMPFEITFEDSCMVFDASRVEGGSLKFCLSSSGELRLNTDGAFYFPRGTS